MAKQQIDLRRLRKLAGMSQAELAKEAGMNRPRISYLEGGYRSAQEEARLREILEQRATERAQTIREVCTLV